MKLNKFLLSILGILLISNLQAQNLPIYYPFAPGFNPPVSNTIPGNTGTFTLPTPYNQGANPDPSIFNYQRIFTPQIPISDKNQVNESSNASYYKQSTIYTDGFDRNMQAITQFTSQLKSTIQIYDNRPSITQYEYLPYPTSANNKTFQKSAFADQRSYYNGVFPNEPNTAVSKTISYSDANKRSVIKYREGKTNIGQDRGFETYGALNATFHIYNLSVDEPGNAAGPIKMGFYSEKMLTRKTTISPDGSTKHTFFDKGGRLICETVLLDEVDCGPGEPGGDPNSLVGGPTQGGCQVFATTYYIYDRLDRLRYVLSPKAVQELHNNSWNFTSTILTNLCDRYEYDNAGRLIQKYTQGKTFAQEFVYDKSNRIVLTRNTFGVWNFTLYDKLGRETVTGKINSGDFRANWQNVMDNGSTSSYTTSQLEHHLLKPTTPGSYPSILNNCDFYSYTYYDNYSDAFFTGLGFPGNYNSAAFNGNTVATAFAIQPPSSPTGKTRGFVTGKKTRVLKPSGVTVNNVSDWESTIYYYDDYGRNIQVKKQNFRSGWNTQSTQYDFTGRIIRSTSIYQNPQSTKGFTTVKLANSYEDKTFSLTMTQFDLDNSNNWKSMVTYGYDDLQKNTSKVVGAIESQYYDFNVRGELTAINRSYVESPGISTSASFGEILRYDHGYTKPLYGGNISGMAWKGPDGIVKTYGYVYDKAGRLKDAEYRQLSEVGMMQGGQAIIYKDWNNNDKDYSEKEILYDLNGNIKALKRYGVVNNGSQMQPDVIDELNYAYEDDELSNRLYSVSDGISMINQSIDYDFKDNNATNNDYTYDDNGNIISDNNRDAVYINNKFLNKKTRIQLGNGDIIDYIYDAEGNKLMELYSGSKNEVYEYIDNLTYKNGNLLTVNNQEGYSLYDNGSYKHYVYIKDHLNNVRNVKEAYQTSAEEITYPPATFEPSNLSTEEMIFEHIGTVSDVKPGSLEPQDQFAALLDAQNPDRRIGSVILLSVMAGDKYELNAESYYAAHNAPINDDVIADDMLNSIVGALTGSDGFTSGEGGSIDLTQNFFNTTNYVDAFENVKGAMVNPNRPKSYLNYLRFDNDFKLIEEESGIIQVGCTPNIWDAVTTATMDILQSGYLLVYVSSEDRSVITYWDNVSLYYWRGRLTQENHYYPFGLTVTNNLINTPLENNYLFSTNKLEKYNNLGLYDFKAREYDPQIGRFNSVDRLADRGTQWSPFSYSFNNPITFADGNGLWPVYTLSGQYLGDNGVHVNGLDLGYIGERNLGGFANLVQFTSNHTQFQTMANIIKHEATSTDYKEYLWMAHTVHNQANFATKGNMYKLLMSGYSSVETEFKVPLSTNNNSAQANMARAGFIDVLMGNEDPTSGARFWDGTDFLAWGLNSPNGTPHNKFEEYSHIFIDVMNFNAYENAQVAEYGSTVKYGKGANRKSYDLPADVFDITKYPGNWGAYPNSLTNTTFGFNYSTGYPGNILNATGTAGQSVFWTVTKP